MLTEQARRAQETARRVGDALASGRGGAAESLQRQRSAALIQIEKQQHDAITSLQKQRSAALIAEERSRLSAVESLQKQRSASLIKFEQQQQAAITSLQKQRSAALIAEEKKRTSAVESLQSQRSRALLSQEQQRVSAVESLQRQRSRALIAEANRYDRQERARIRARIDDEIRELNRLDAARRRAATQPTAGGRGGLGFIGTSIAAAGGFIAANTIREGGRAWLDYASKLENTRIAFTTMMGSAQAADAHLRQLQQFAIETPFHFSELIDASARMRALGFATEEVIPLLRDVGNVTAASGDISADRLQRIIKALSDVRSRGALYSQEIRQFAEAAIPVYDILEKQLGKTRAELVKMVEAGEITAPIFFKAFQSFSRANFGDLMEQQSRTFRGAMSNITDILLQTSQTAFDPFYREISQLAVRTSQEIQGQDFEGAIQTVLESAFRGAGSGVASIAIEVIDKFFDSAEQQAQKRSRSFSPIRLGEVLADQLITDLQRDLQGRRPGQRSFSEIEQEAVRIQAERTRQQANELLNNLRGALSGGTQQQQESAAANKLLEKQQDIVGDLSLRLRFFGDNSEVAATKQRLLAAGVTDLNSGLAQQAIRIAEVIDRMRQQAEIDEALRKSRQDAANDLARSLDDTRRAAQEQAEVIESSLQLGRELTGLERFDFSDLADRAKTAGPEFSLQLDLTRGAVERLDKALSEQQAVEDRKKALESLTTTARRMTDSLLESLNPPQTNFGRFIRDLEKMEGLASSISTEAKFDDLFKDAPESADRVQRFTDRFYELLAAANEGPVKFKLTADEILTLARNFGHAADAALKLDRQLREQDALERFTAISEELQAVIHRDVELTNRQRIEKLLLADAYRNLTEAQRESLRVQADEADFAEATRKLRDASERLADEQRERMEDLAGDIASIFRTSLDAAGQGFEEWGRKMARIGQSIAGDIAEEFIRSGLTELFTGQKPDVSTGPGGIVGAIGEALGLYSDAAKEEVDAMHRLIDALNANTLAQGGTPTTPGGLPILPSILDRLPGGLGSLFGGGAEQQSARLSTFGDFESFFDPGARGGPFPTEVYAPTTSLTDKLSSGGAKLSSTDPLRLVVVDDLREARERQMAATNERAVAVRMSTARKTGRYV